MAKVKKEGTEEKEKEEFESLDNAFQPHEGDEQAEQETKATEKTDKTETVTTEKVETEQVKDGKVEDPETADEATDKEKSDTTEANWKKYGLGRLDGMNREQIAAEINWRNRQAGEQANELGKLRKRVAEFEKETPAKEPEKQEPADLIPDMTPGEVEDFNRLWETNPTKAIFKYGGQKVVASMLQNQVKEAIPEALSSSMEQERDALAFASFRQNNEDAQELQPLMKTLDEPQHLGNQARSYNELAQLARLGRDGDKSYTPVYAIMSKHPTVSFAEAKKFASLPTGSSTKPDEVRKTVKKIDSANAPTTKSVSKSEKVYDTIDDAFDSVDDSD